MYELRQWILIASACAAVLALPIACDHPEMPCKPVRVEGLRGGCALSWSCHDGVFRVECTARDDGDADCTCTARGTDTGTFVSGEICALPASDSARCTVNDGCGWNVVVDSATDMPDACAPMAPPGTDGGSGAGS